MSQFSLPRFQRLLLNDALRFVKPVVYANLALLGLTVLIYLNSFEPGQQTDPPLAQVLFGIYLMGQGLLFTSVSFQDMHHPLERYQYLMLPVSNLERFLSRYLVTGPLFILYVIATFFVMDWVGNQLASAWIDVREPSFTPFASGPWVLIRVYLFTHILMLTGAICFRSYALIKTVLSLVLLAASLGAVSYVAMRIFYWDAFSWRRFEPTGEIHMLVEPMFAASWMNITVAIGFALWILHVAYRCLRAHEVQDGL
jgi:hypothetical protein